MRTVLSIVLVMLLFLHGSLALLRPVCPPGCLCNKAPDHDSIVCRGVNLLEVGLFLKHGLRDLNCMMRFQEGRRDAHLLVNEFVTRFNKENPHVKLEDMLKVQTKENIAPINFDSDAVTAV